MQQRNAAKYCPVVGLLLLFGSLGPSSVLAEERRFEVGARYIVVTAGGEPTNDQSGVGVFGRYRWTDRWLVGAAIDSVSGDVERPYEWFGNTSPEEIDSSVDSTIFSGWIEREHGKQDRKLKWFWNAGLGVASPEVDDVQGPLTGGRSFDITTDAGSETLLSGALGLRRGFSKRFGFEVGLRFSRHFADWKVTDRSSGDTATLEDYTTKGLHLGLRVAF